MADPKQQIMSQVREQAALANARQLVEVGNIIAPTHSNSLDLKLTRTSLIETQRTLLRTLRPETRHLSQLLRTNLLHALHGEVHGGVEYGVKTIFGTRAEER